VTPAAKGVRLASHESNGYIYGPGGLPIEQINSGGGVPYKYAQDNPLTWSDPTVKASRSRPASLVGAAHPSIAPVTPHALTRLDNKRLKRAPDRPVHVV
jgi:hypothetical protein